jgi:hypothetical protein
MIVIGPVTRRERLEVMQWQAGTACQTPAVRRFLLVYRFTFALALITREKADQCHLN